MLVFVAVDDLVGQKDFKTCQQIQRVPSFKSTLGVENEVLAYKDNSNLRQSLHLPCYVVHTR